MNIARCLGITLVICVAPLFSNAAPLTQAKISKIINDVRVVDRESGAVKAKINDLIHDEVGVRTGVKSRSELVFEDDTLTRLGPETSFNFKAGTRDLTLEKGSMLLQVPKGLGGATIRTAAVTAAITGTTIMLEYVPGQRVKVLVLEGRLRLGMTEGSRRQVVLRPGQMVLMPATAKRVPEPVTIDLARVVQTSALVNMKSNGKNSPLPSIALVEQEIHIQDVAKANNLLIATNTSVIGSTVFDTVSNRRDASPTSQSAPSIPTATPPPVSSTPPPVSTPPDPITATPPPVTATPPPVAATPPPVTATPPPVTATPPPVSATPPPNTGGDEGDDHDGGHEGDDDGDKKKHDGHKGGGGDGLRAPSVNRFHDGGRMPGAHPFQGAPRNAPANLPPAGLTAARSR